MAIGSVPDTTAEVESARSGPGVAVVWGVAALVVAAVLAAFWLVIEATPARNAAAKKTSAARSPSDSATAAAAPTPIHRPLQPVAAAPAPASRAPGLPAAAPSGDVAHAPLSASSLSPAGRAAPAGPRAGASTAAPAPARIAGGVRPVSPSLSGRAAPRVSSAGAIGLRDALDAWIDSTNARDLSGHMRFYLPKVGTFYRTRNVSREFVRQEKARLFRGGPVSVAADEPEIDPSPDGRSATVRFRKRYAVSGARGEKRGEVLQEMKWIRTPEGWRIAGERDSKVLASR